MTPLAARPRLQRIGARFAEHLLGTEPTDRRLAARVLLSVLLYAASLFLELLGLEAGFVDGTAVTWLAAYIVVGSTAFYALVRSGWNKRIRDPSMTAQQILFAISALLLAYPVSGPFRGLTLLAVVAPPLFAFFSMSRRESLVIVASVPALFGTVMYVLARHFPASFDPRVEAAHFVILLGCMLSLGSLLSQISARRDRFRTQKLELSLALDRIEAISTRDELTGVFNRRFMTARLADEVARRARGGAPFCACLIDVDFFKRINDVHGHARGDAVLRSFARVLQAGLRETDLLARWGGEEFLLLMPATELESGVERLERLRRFCAEIGDWRDVAPLNVRFSAGLAEDGRGTVADILHRADVALYRAKAAGRDCVVKAAAA